MRFEVFAVIVWVAAFIELALVAISWSRLSTRGRVRMVLSVAIILFPRSVYAQRDAVFVSVQFGKSAPQALENQLTMKDLGPGEVFLCKAEPIELRISSRGDGRYEVAWKNGQGPRQTLGVLDSKNPRLTVDVDVSQGTIILSFSLRDYARGFFGNTDLPCDQDPLPRN